MNEVERRYKPIDKYLKKYLKDYNQINKETQDTLQNIFKELEIGYTDLNKKIPTNKKARLDRRLEKLLKAKEDNYMYYVLKKALDQKSMTYRELLESYIISAYYEERKTLDEYDNTYFYETLETSYMQGIEDIRKIPHKKRRIKEIFNWSILYTILNIPLLYGTKEAYLYALSMTNAEEMYKRAINDMQGNKPLDIDNQDIQDLLLKQRNRLISISDDKYSGAIENMTESYCNLAYLQSGKDNDVRQCRFIAVRDKRTTKMCESLDDQIFDLDRLNIYKRYSDVDEKIITYYTKGMVLGENLPPIMNHFHWCRSTITYNVYEDIAEYVRENIKIATKEDKKQFERYKKYYGDEITDDVEEFARIKTNNDPRQWNELKRNYFDRKLRYTIKNDYNLKVNQEQYNKHIPGTYEYNTKSKREKHPSEIYLTIDEEQKLIHEFAGTGRLRYNKQHVFMKKEENDFGIIIGRMYSKSLGRYVDTTYGTIHYSGNGTHIVPRIED